MNNRIETVGMSAIDLVDQYYQEEYLTYIQERNLPNSEGSALAFIQEYEKELDL